MKQKLYSGYLSKKDYEDAYDVLFLSSVDDPLTEELMDALDQKQVTIRYWVTKKECTKDQAQEFFIRELFGELNAEYSPCYSEATGYLWTTEELNIGGHNLLDELSSYVEKYLILEIDIHDTNDVSRQEVQAKG